jgi:hypothetical protein
MRLATTSISVPGWNAAGPADSFRAFAAQLHGQAREILIKDGYHAQMFFLVRLNGDGHIVIWNSNDRDLAARWLRSHIAKYYIYGVIHVVEAWLHTATGPGDHTYKQLMAGEMKVGDLKPEHRQEALMVSAQSRDGWAVSWVDEILRDGSGKLSLGGSRQLTDLQGRFGQVFG